KANLAVLFGSYSMAFTTAGTPNLFLLKSTILSLCLWPPPKLRAVILPALFLPPELFLGASNVFSGFDLVISSNAGATLNLVPGVTGFNFLTAMILIQLNFSVKINYFSIRDLNNGFLKRIGVAGDNFRFCISGLMLRSISHGPD